jgi:hypothetical protein
MATSSVSGTAVFKASIWVVEMNPAPIRAVRKRVIRA